MKANWKYILATAVPVLAIAMVVWWTSYGYDAWLERRADRNILALMGLDGAVGFRSADDPLSEGFTETFANFLARGWPWGDIASVDEMLRRSEMSALSFYLRPGSLDERKFKRHEFYGPTMVVDARGGYRVFAPGTGRREILRALATADAITSSTVFDDYGRPLPESSWRRVCAREEDLLFEPPPEGRD